MLPLSLHCTWPSWHFYSTHGSPKLSFLLYLLPSVLHQFNSLSRIPNFYSDSNPPQIYTVCLLPHICPLQILNLYIAACLLSTKKHGCGLFSAIHQSIPPHCFPESFTMDCKSFRTEWGNCVICKHQQLHLTVQTPPLNCAFAFAFKMLKSSRWWGLPGILVPLSAASKTTLLVPLPQSLLPRLSHTEHLLLSGICLALQIWLRSSTDVSKVYHILFQVCKIMQQTFCYPFKCLFHQLFHPNNVIAASSSSSKTFLLFHHLTFCRLL